jgi:predicted ATPase/class 3 adenylate cyclase
MNLPLDAPKTWPSGFVTFVLTDIEGSTRLLRRLGNRYDELIDRHNSLLRSAWEDHGGVSVSERGDSCLAAFSDASSALAACADAQRRLTTAPFAPGARPRVRMGLHAGVASPRGGDYVALAVHQAARVSAAAHGGQVLASDVVAAEVGDIPGLTLTPMGRYRLRDFDEPVQLHCLRVEDLEPECPAVRGVPADGHNLAAPATSLIGRDGDVDEIVPRLGAGRLITLVGPGGVGKSRLALAAGLAAAPNWEDGVWYVDLSPLQDPRLIGTTVGAALGISRGGGVDAWEATLEQLREKRLVLLMDNCEHLAANAASAVGELLATCSSVGVMATSREPLGIAREHVLRINPLPLPPRGASLDTAAAIPSVQLFVERARANSPRFTLDDSNVGYVVELCRRLDGLPLALELAAAQTAVVGISDLTTGIDDRPVLRSRHRDVPDRQRTMDAVVDWSLRLLTPEEQAVLRRLSILRGGFTLAVAVAAAADVEGCEVPDAVWALVDKSLVVVDVAANDTRYRLLETVRAPLRHLLDEEQATVATALRLCRWWLDRVGPWQRTDRERSGEIEVELDNLRTIVPLVAEENEELAQQLVCSIGRHFYAVNLSQDAVSELARYATDLTAPTPARVSMLATLALMHVHHGDVDGARRVLETAAEDHRVVGAPSWDQVGIERAAGEVALRTGDHGGAAELARQALDRDLDLAARARMFNLLAIASYFSGDITRAGEAFEQELDVARRLGDEHLIVIAEGNVSELAMRTGDVASAARHQQASLELSLALGRPVGVALSFIVAARLSAPGDPGLAAQLHAKAEAILTEHDYQLYDDDLRASREMLDDVSERLGHTYFTQACDDGRALALLDAITLAERTFALVADENPQPKEVGHVRH